MHALERPVRPAIPSCRALHTSFAFLGHPPRTSCRCNPRKRHSTVQSTQADTEIEQPTHRIPQDADSVAQQALAACQRAFKAGVRRQQLELLLPLIGATDIDDWPGGVRQQFKAVLPMVESILQGLKSTPELQGPLQASIWDQGDAVGAWLGDKLVAVVFPTPETLPQATQAAGVDAAEGKLALLINPQWQPGQVISDFGLGAKRRDCEKFLGAFQDVYYLRQQRISGDEILVLRSYPDPWQVHLVKARGGDDFIHSQETKPSYRELEAILKGIQGSSSSQTWAQRLRSEFAFNKESLNRKN
ncbi:hypothetical protein WJX82_003981 [Trebouxia sp. C0006]